MASLEALVWRTSAPHTDEGRHPTHGTPPRGQALLTHLTDSPYFSLRHNTPLIGRDPHPHCMDVETEAQRRDVTCPSQTVSQGLQ